MAEDWVTVGAAAPPPAAGAEDWRSVTPPAPPQRPGQQMLESIPYAGHAIAALNAATAKSQDWFAPTKFLNSISNPLMDYSGVQNKDIAAADSARAEAEHPVASVIGAAGGALMNLPPDTAMPINPLTMPLARLGVSTAGGALGGASQGNTVGERAENALYGGGAGLALGGIGEGARAAMPAIKPALHALQGVSLPAYLALEHYADWFKENVMRHAPLAAAAIGGLFGAPYLAPKVGELFAPNPTAAPAPQ